MSLACGGRGPCCHIGYAHRHCEHCDVVIPVAVQPHTHYPYQWPWQHAYYGNLLGGYSSGLGNQLQQFSSSLQITEVPIDAGEQRASS